MGKEEYDNLMSMLTFINIQNAAILQLLTKDREQYEKLHKLMLKDWEQKVEETINENKAGN